MATAAWVTVATTAGGTALWSVPTSNATFLKGAEVVVRNRGAVAVFLGGSGVATTDGFQIDPGESVSFRCARGEVLYGITASTTCVVHVLRMKRAESGADF